MIAAMSKVAQQWMASFEVLVQLLRPIIGAPYSSLSDEELFRRQIWYFKITIAMRPKASDAAAQRGLAG